MRFSRKTILFLLLGLAAIVISGLVRLNSSRVAETLPETKPKSRFNAGNATQNRKNPALNKGAEPRAAPQAGTVREPIRPEISPYVSSLINNPHLAPSSQKVRELSASDIQELISAYKRETNIVSRESIVRALSLVGGDEVVDLFWHSLTQEFAGRQFTRSPGELYNDENMLEIIVPALGYLAVQNDKAYALLKNGTDPSFWTTHIPWRTAEGRIPTRVLTAYSLQGIGKSGRPDAMEFLRRYAQKLNENSNLARGFGGDLLEAVFLFDYCQWHGTDKLFDLRVQNYRDAFSEWAETENGKTWKEWYKASKK